MVVQVMDSYFIKFRADGERLWTWRKVTAAETFGSLKRKEIEAMLSSGSIGRDSNVEEVENHQSQYCIRILYLSLLRLAKLSLSPSDNELVLPVLEREEGNWPGSVIVCMMDRRFEFAAYLDYIGSEEKLRPSQYHYEKGRTSTEWVPLHLHQLLSHSQCESSIPTLWEHRFNQLCDNALLHGTIQRRVFVDGRTEAWRDEYVVIHTDKIWFANAKFWETEKQFCCVEIEPNGKATIGNGGLFTVPCVYFEEKEVVFRCKSHEVAESWVLSINNRFVVGSNNSTLDRIENSLCDAEFEASYDYFQLLSAQHRGMASFAESSAANVPAQFDSVLPSLRAISCHHSAANSMPDAVPLHDTHISPCSISVSTLNMPSSVSKVVKCGLMRCCYRVKSTARSGIFFTSPIGNGSTNSLSSMGIAALSEDTSGSAAVVTPPRSTHSFSKDSISRVNSDSHSLANPSDDIALPDSVGSPSTPNSYPVSRFRSSSTYTMYEDFAKTQLSESVSDGTVQHIAIVEVFGTGKLMLFDPIASYYPNVAIELYNIKQVQLSKTVMNCIELVEETGCVWSLTPMPVDEADDLHICESWLTPLFRYLNHSARVRSVHIVYSGYVMKRGAVNKSFKRRWMVLTSDGKLRYFKDTVAKTYKGSILLRSVVSVTSSAIETKASWLNFFDRGAADRDASRMEFTLRTSDRTWIFQCESAKCSIWCGHMCKYIGGANSSGANSSTANSGSPGHNVTIVDDEGEGLGDDSDLDE